MRVSQKYKQSTYSDLGSSSSVVVLVRLPYLEGCKVSIRSMTEAMGWDLPAYKSTISSWHAEKTQTKCKCLNAEEPTVLWQSADI